MLLKVYGAGSGSVWLEISQAKVQAMPKVKNRCVVKNDQMAAPKRTPLVKKCSETGWELI
jgi:hypothetical protein